MTTQGLQAVIDLYNTTDLGQVENSVIDLNALNDFFEGSPLEMFKKFENVPSVAACKDQQGNLDELSLVEALRGCVNWLEELPNNNIIIQTL